MKKQTEIIKLLQKDAKLKCEEIAAMIQIAPEDVASVVKDLEESGIILRYAALINTEKMEEAPAEAIVQLKVCPQKDLGYDDIAKRVYKYPEVKAVYLMAGRYDLEVVVEMDTMKAISQFVWEKLAVLDGVSSTETLFIMRKYKENGELLVGGNKEERLVVSP